MRKKFYLFPVAVAFIFCFSCKKDAGKNSQAVVIDTTIASGTLYSLNLKPYGDADDVATIIQQAKNYSTSEITSTGSGFSAVYSYAATAKTSTTDQVVISVKEGNSRRGNCSDSTKITINFTVK